MKKRAAPQIETCIDYCERESAYMSSNERRWITQLRKLAASRPKECVILKQPEENGGFIYVKFPPKWVRVRPPRQVSISDAERAKRSFNIIKYMESKHTEEEGCDVAGAARSITSDD